MKNTKTLPPHAVYSDVVNARLILPFKNKYTLADFKKLVKAGWSQLDARFIVLCSWAYHDTDMSHIFDTNDFLIHCQYEVAIWGGKNINEEHKNIRTSQW